jgi:succinate dehydrogenase/fumarate reductase flavoprotein subunit
MRNFNSDVLVIGGGGGGSMAAYEASKHGVSVNLVLKGRPQRSGATIMAPGAIAGVGEWHVQGDSKDIHFHDTVKGGSYMNEQRLVRIMVEESPDLIVELERIGALWQREEDERTYSLRIDGGHSFHRCPFLEDRTGREMLRTLYGELKKRNINVVPDVIILELLVEEGRVCGAAGLNLADCEPVLFRAKSVILACGGAGNLYLNTSTPTGVTGDGYALALQAGASLMDMEFVQFYPLGFLFPDSLRGALAGLLYYSQLRNKLGERFMEKYDSERLELSTRDRVARAMFKEVREGRGGPHGGVFMDMTFHEPDYIPKMQPALYKTYRKLGLDPAKDWVEVAPTCHFFMGGIKVNEQWQSSVQGLFAVGENAAGIHGANRLSQNALAELLVSGARSGRAAADFASKADQSNIDPSTALRITSLAEVMLASKAGMRPVYLRKKLRQLMWDKVGVSRTETGIRSAIEELKGLRAELERQEVGLKSKHFNQELLEGLENHFLVAVAECVTLGALHRTESRGAHYRDDFPETNNQNWLQHLLIQKRHGNLAFEKAPVDLCEIKPSGV